MEDHIWESNGSVGSPSIGPRDARNPEEIVTEVRQVEVLCGQGMLRGDAISQVQLTEQTFYRWRTQHGSVHCPKGHREAMHR